MAGNGLSTTPVTRLDQLERLVEYSPLIGGYRLISHDRAARELDYHPRPLRESFVDTVQWFETAGFLARRPQPSSKELLEG